MLVERCTVHIQEMDRRVVMVMVMKQNKLIEFATGLQQDSCNYEANDE